MTCHCSCCGDDRKKLLLLCGGRSTEHEISIISCHSVAAAVDRHSYDVAVAGIDQDGVWHFYGDGEFAVNPQDPRKVHLAPGGIKCFPGRNADGAVLILEDGSQWPFQIIFPVLHGAFGEDGTVQGMVAMLGVPCVGCGVAASACAMDKALTKTILAAEGFRTARGVTLREGEECSPEFIGATLGYPVFVKPAHAGSSVGISRVTCAEELPTALAEAFRYDEKVLIEESVPGREIECAVLELPDGTIFAAHPGEVVPKGDFYSYAAKYLDGEDGAALHIQAQLPEKAASQVRKLAEKAFRALDGNGMARVDFFYSEERGFVLNEINTIPGFTSISLYPQMMNASGIPYGELVATLLESAVAREQRARAKATAAMS